MGANMLKLLLAAGLLATAAVPSFTAAQPYDSTPRYAGDDRDSYSDQDNDNDADDDADSVWPNNDYANSDRYNYDYDRAYNPGSHYDQSYTGRVGAGWVDPSGRHCRWREVSWTDRDGNQAYKWVPTCRG